jgi:F0F1-type ATP synthase membrane subunit c/vacuolar-type H+-ATPase subunit K
MHQPPAPSFGRALTTVIACLLAAMAIGIVACGGTDATSLPPSSASAG